MNQIFDRALVIEEFFCKDNLLELRKAFSWIEFGKYVASVDKYSPYDGFVVYKHPEGSTMMTGRFDFKHSSRNATDTIRKFSIKDNCNKALKHQKNSILFIYSEPSEMLYAIDYDKVKTSDSEFPESVSLTNLQAAMLDFARFPLV